MQENSVDAIPAETDLFGPIMEQTVLLKEQHREYLPMSILQDGHPIEFMVKGADQLYLDLNDSWMRFLVKFVNAAGADVGADLVGPIKLIAHALFAQISAELNGKQVGDTNNYYHYKAYIQTLINYCKETQDTRLLAEGWTKDTSGQMGITVCANNGANTGLRARVVRMNNSTVVEYIMRPHFDIFQQDRLIPPGIDLHLKLIPNAANFVCKTTAPGDNAVQIAYKPHISFAGLYIKPKQLTNEAELAHRAPIRERVMRLPHTRV